MSVGFITVCVRFSLGTIFVLSLVITGCTTSRYSMKYDAGPIGEFDARLVPEAVPVWEPLSPRGNKSPYVVRGKQYQVMTRIKGYSEVGVASWYGLKFHGELTSNGEVYNMYEMSAAHKSLPLPSFVRVTNLENNLNVIVRVNDRGPFHSGRIIDLSYAAAKKLGYDKKGTAKIKLDVISPARHADNGAALQPDRLAIFVQVGAFSNEKAAQDLKLKAEKLARKHEIFVAKVLNQKKSLYRVRVGPVLDREGAEKIVGVLESKGVGRPVIITRALSAKDR
ncbi:MAG: rare lipoprotein A [Pseudohongiellaceae bacterium]